MKKPLVAEGVFFAFLLFGGGWISLLHVLPEGLPRTLGVTALGVVFVLLFLRLVFIRVRHLLLGSERFALHAVLALADVVLLILAFAVMYRELGIMDNTRPGRPVIHQFWLSAYYSVVTFTTLGYGDFYPVGLGRVLAALQAVTGYIVLAVLASTAASVISPYSKAGPDPEL